MADLDVHTALHKFGLGARQGEADQVVDDPKLWLLAQLTDVSSELDAAEYGLMTSEEGIIKYFDFLQALRDEENARQPVAVASLSGKDQLGVFVANMKRARREERMIEDRGVRGTSLASARNAYIDGAKSSVSKPAAGKTSDELINEIFDNYYAEIGVRSLHAALTPASFRESLVRFWSDHFNVYAEKSILMIATAGAMEREAIRPHITGKFADMLVAVETHPTMLIYLDNIFSVGPNSVAGQLYELGINENLAREILELHTLGVNGGYGQGDIISFANAITGWTIGNPDLQPENIGSYIFEPLLHEPGMVNILGKAYLGTGQNQGLDILADLAVHDSTAAFIAKKMARHFHSDQPPQSLIDRLELAFKDSGGDLMVLGSVLVTSPEMWEGTFPKLRNSEEFVIAMIRAFGLDELTPQQLVFVFDTVTQVPFTQPSPAGWPKDEASWASSSVSSARINLASLVGGFVSSQPQPSSVARDIMGPMLSALTETGIEDADTVEQGYALMMMSPEFQRR